MAKASSDTELLEFAIYRETEAYNLFMALAESVNNPRIKKLLEDLAQEELGHKSQLEFEIIKTGQTLSENQQPPFTDSLNEYIIRNSSLPLDMSYEDVLLLCIEKEDTSFRIYINMLSNTNNEQLRETLMELAQEEVKHKLRIEAEYETPHKQK